ncbi:hypothetical protein BMWSH_2354 [Priestia megaterium WSH-002]|jgi:hypothetical protein|uniref:Uncharacterized protein n=1 Tax=Priestia megaterium (strain WSH-002) TaxID=1006007 RepID=A0A8D3WYW6_PRIMW|nr:hypothetical protein BMWSH_2354 [Priestia megaterium WSH-002]
MRNKRHVKRLLQRRIRSLRYVVLILFTILILKYVSEIM